MTVQNVFFFVYFSEVNFVGLLWVLLNLKMLELPWWTDK